MSTHHEGQPLASGEGIDDAGVKRKRGTAIKLLLIFCAMYFRINRVFCGTGLIMPPPVAARGCGAGA